MNTQFKLIGAVAGLAFAASAQAQQAPLASLSNSITKEWVRCHNITSVPITADAEQSLPMQVTGNLACGEEVAVLSDIEGYTVNVRTADDRFGYVARMYLSASAPVQSNFGKPLASAEVQNNVARWTPGAAGSDQFMSDDSLVESLTANEGRAEVFINPAKFMMTELSPAARPLMYQDPKEMAKSVSHGVLWTTNRAISPASSQSASAM